MLNGTLVLARSKYLATRGKGESLALVNFRPYQSSRNLDPNVFTNARMSHICMIRPRPWSPSGGTDTEDSTCQRRNTHASM